MSEQHWQLELDDAGIAWLKIDKHDGGANVLSGPVLRELNDLLDELHAKPPAGVVIYSGKPSGFIMGADINEFTKIENTEQAYTLIRLGQQVLDRIEALPCPSVAYINGFALGGGLELLSNQTSASSACPKCSLVSTPDLAAPSVRSDCVASDRRCN